MLNKSDLTNEIAATGSEARAVEVISSTALERRRLLLKGLGKGSAVLAATVPIATLATASTLSVTPSGKGGAPAGLRCTLSGIMSGVHSQETVTAQCGGYSPGWWGQHYGNGKNKSTTVPSRPWPTNPNQLYNAVFTIPEPGLPSGLTLFQVMGDPTYSETQTRHWIGAWLNALGGHFNFPYTSAEILGFYFGSDPDRASAYSLITTYLENHT